jgi:hypothetical protein
MSGTIRIDNRLVIRKARHIVGDLGDSSSHMQVVTRAVKQGVAKLVPDTARRAKRRPVTIEHMHALRVGRVNLSNVFDAAVLALACAAYWSCCRLGELSIPSVGTFNPAKHVSR